MEIFAQYQPLVSLVEELENPLYSIKDAYAKVSSLDLSSDSCRIKPYIYKRLNNFEKTDIKEIIHLSREDISPATYSMLQNCQATTAAVEKLLNAQENTCKG